MALFSALRGKKRNATGPNALRKDLITPAIFMIQVDGTIDKREVAKLAECCLENPLFAGISGEQFAALVTGIESELTSKDVDVILPRAIEGLPMPLRETALAISVKIAFADGQLATEEADVLKLLAKQMGIPDATLAGIAEVLAMFQRTGNEP